MELIERLDEVEMLANAAKRPVTRYDLDPDGLICENPPAHVMWLADAILGLATALRARSADND